MFGVQRSMFPPNRAVPEAGAPSNGKLPAAIGAAAGVASQDFAQLGAVARADENRLDAHQQRRTIP
jgi:hypothetical protein